MKLSPQITQINTDYKRYKKISLISVPCGLFSWEANFYKKEIEKLYIVQ